MKLATNCVVKGALLIVAALIATPVTAAEIKVVSSPAAAGALIEAARDFERSTGHKVVLDFSNIATTRKRIDAGEMFDIAVVSPKQVEELLQQGKIVAGTSFNLGRSGLALVGRKGTARPDIGSVEAFKGALLDAKLVAYSATGESGIGFLKVLDKLGIAAEMKPRIRTTSTLAETVETGWAVMGITGVSAALSYTKLEYIGPLPAGVQEYVYLAAGVCTSAKAPEAARALVKSLREPAVVGVMSSKGLEPTAN